MKQPPVLLLFAVKEETSFITNPALPHECLTLITGMGKNNALHATKQALSNQKPPLVLTCGFAGGLNPKLDPCQVLFQTNASTRPSLTRSLEEAGARAANFHTSDHVIITREEKTTLRKSTGADAVEMESGPVMNFCEENGIPCATVRVISDAASENLPVDFNKLMNEHQELSKLRLVGTLLRSPGTIPGLIRLGKRTRRAAHRLAEVILKLKLDL